MLNVTGRDRGPRLLSRPSIGPRWRAIAVLASSLLGCGAEPFYAQLPIEIDAHEEPTGGSGGAPGYDAYRPPSSPDAGTSTHDLPQEPATGSGGSGPDALADLSGTGGTSDAGASPLDGGLGGIDGISGTGGAPAVDGCARASWTIAASMLCNTASCVNIPASQKDPRFAIDGDLVTRYTSGRPQGSNGAETVTLTFPHGVTISGLQLKTPKAGDGPAAYRVQHAPTGTDFTDFVPAASGTGADDLSVTLPVTTMKALRITQTGTKTGPWWSIHELTLIGCQN